MQVVEPYAKILTPTSRLSGVAMLENIENYARVSHRSEDAQTHDSWDRFIRSVVMQHGDFSVIEHCSASVEMLVDRGITHELVRHRIASYTQESTRFVNYQKKGGEAKFVKPIGLSTENLLLWLNAVDLAERTYMHMLNGGVPPQLARGVLPNSLASKIIITMNLRSWRHFFIMRTTAEAHPQMREVTIPLLAAFQDVIPILYEDIVPNAKQIENLRLPR